jgi:hypothetical protein
VAQWAITMVIERPENPSRARPDRAAIEQIVCRATW